MTSQQEQAAIRMARRHVSNVEDCLADEHELSQALLSLHGRLEEAERHKKAARAARNAFEDDVDKLSAELTEARRQLEIARKAIADGLDALNNDRIGKSGNILDDALSQITPTEKQS